jgi:hypothetical protein
MPAKSLSFRSAASGVALVALFGAASITMSQCTMVRDHLTGVSLHRVSPISCVEHCKNFYDNLFALERKRHLGAVEACRALPATEKQDCLIDEQARHQAASDELTQGKIDCLDACARPSAGGLMTPASTDGSSPRHAGLSEE